jgi:hypothetical protein
MSLRIKWTKATTLLTFTPAISFQVRYHLIFLLHTVYTRVISYCREMVWFGNCTTNRQFCTLSTAWKEVWAVCHLYVACSSTHTCARIQIMVAEEVHRTHNCVLLRNYPQNKITENIECEIMQVVLDEARESYDERIVQGTIFVSFVWFYWFKIRCMF